MLRIWDGLLEEDWLDSLMQQHESEYCLFRELTCQVMTWNAGATKPRYLDHSMQDSNFFHDYINTRDAPDIFVFGFQELVDLEDKKTTAKAFFKSKKKDTNEQEHMSHQYRAWRDHLTRCLEDFMPADQPYTLLHTASLVGLFTCVFVKSAERNRIKHVHTAEVKRGMGGLHGNKGALIMRLVLDDSSMCFVNCHLAAGQTQTIQRNNDVAGILESEALPPYPLSQNSSAQHSDVFSSGGDGSMILDHDICILNGDLNYRIDTMGRDTVVKQIEKGEISRLLERD
ncbi:DNase I-like protein, partial [Hortaea werneckii]